MSTAGIIVRTASVEDLSAMRNLWQKHLAVLQEKDPYYAGIGRSDERFEDFIREHIDSEESSVGVALAGDETVGYCIAEVSVFPPIFEERYFGTVYDLVVAADYQKQGVARELFNQARDYFAERGIERIELRVSLANEVSRAFWEEEGFSPYVSVLYKDL